MRDYAVTIDLAEFSDLRAQPICERDSIGERPGLGGFKEFLQVLKRAVAKTSFSITTILSVLAPRYVGGSLERYFAKAFILFSAGHNSELCSFAPRRHHFQVHCVLTRIV